MTIVEIEGRVREVEDGGSLGWSVEVTLGCADGASDAVAVGLGAVPVGEELPSGVTVGDPEGPRLEVVVGRSLGWSIEVTLG